MSFCAAMILELMRFPSSIQGGDVPQVFQGEGRPPPAHKPPPPASLTLVKVAYCAVANIQYNWPPCTFNLTLNHFIDLPELGPHSTSDLSAVPNISKL